MKRIILGTAGHIDHGKTSLIKALTGVDCDRLKEEKKRGITIELGFTSLTLPGGQRVGIVDVPGHEKFVKNMVAGAGGIDAVIMVIAADEGIMPQTREHLDICNILAIKSGIIVLSKADLVDDEWMELVKSDLLDAVEDTFLKDAPVIAVSATTGSGLDELLSAIEQLLSDIKERSQSGIMRLPVDRVFSMKGFGTVITGTLLAGKISIGDEVEILPGKIAAKIRGIQVHNELAQAVTAGHRTALNFQGLEKTVLGRGNVITGPGTIVDTRRIDAWLDHLPNSPRPLKNRSVARFHSGTSEIMCRIILLNRDELAPGESDFIQIFLESPAVLLPRDRYVLRSYSPVYTIGGGNILDNLPLKHRRFSKDEIKKLQTLKNFDTRDAVIIFCREAGLKGLDYSHLYARCGLEMSNLFAVTDKMLTEGTIILFSKKPRQITLPEFISEIEIEAASQLKAYHSVNPLKTGLLREELRSKLPGDTNPRLFSFVVEKLLKKGVIEMSKEFLFLQGHKPELKGTQSNIKDKIYLLYKKGGKTPPTKKELIEKIKLPDREAAGILNLLVGEGLIVKLNNDIYYESKALNSLVQQITEHMKTCGELTIQGFKELTGLSRKFMIPCFEYLDRSKITMRMGDKRILRKQTK